MAVLRVTAPDGRAWTVRRRWAPRLGQEALWRRARRRFRSMMGRPDFTDADSVLAMLGEGLATALVVLAVMALFFFVALPLLAVLFDIIVIGLLALLGVVARIVLRRPWTVEAHSDTGGTVHTWRIVGWRASGEHCEEIARRITAGQPLASI